MRTGAVVAAFLAAAACGCTEPAETALKAQQKGKKTVTLVQLRSVATALEMFKAQFGRYPTTQEGLAALVQAPAGETEAAKWSGPYISAPGGKIEDAWGNPLRYERLADERKGYRLWSVGPDGQDGTQDDVANPAEVK